MKTIGAIVGAILFVACGSSGPGGGPVPSGKALTDEQVCREDSPCSGAVGTDAEYEECMDRMRPTADDPCRQALVDQRVCIVKNTQCDAQGMPDGPSSEKSWERWCKQQVQGFDACCSANPDSVFCAMLDH